MVLATQNPIEQEGVYRLPEAQLDRFLFRVHVGYPDREHEVNMLDLHSHPLTVPQPVTNPEEIRWMRQSVDSVYATPEMHAYIVDLIRVSREHPDLLLGGSPRAAISIMKAGKVHALLHERNYLTHADVQGVIQPVLGHRLIMRPESEMDGHTVEEVIQQIIESVAVLQD